MHNKIDSDQIDKIESDGTSESDQQVRFRSGESDLTAGFVERLHSAIGDEPVAAFARRCGISESVIRHYFTGKKPTLDRFAAMAKAAGVSVDWLATGQGVRTRAELLALQRQRGADGLLPPDHPHARRWAKLIELVEQIDDPDRRDAMVADLFARAQEAADIAALRQALAELRAAAKRA